MTRVQCCEKVVQTPQQGLRLNRRPGYLISVINLYGVAIVQWWKAYHAELPYRCLYYHKCQNPTNTEWEAEWRLGSLRVRSRRARSTTATRLLRISALVVSFAGRTLTPLIINY
jgi:hypothetical protein